jgi:hypothetical protein
MRDDRAVRWVILLMLSVATAQAQEPTEGARLFEEGRVFAKQGNWAEACDRFTRSYATDPAAGTDLNLGDCHEHLGHLAEAWRHFDAAVAKFEVAKDDRAKFARERRDALVAKLGIVMIRLADPTVHVTVGGRDEVSAAEMSVHVDPGTIEVRAGAVTHSVQVTAGGTAVVEIPNAAGEMPHIEEPRTERRRDRVYISYAIGGIGAAATIAGVLIGVAAKNQYDAQFDTMHCTKSSGAPICDDIGFQKTSSAITNANVGTGIGAFGVVAVGTAAVLYFTAPRSPVVITPTASAQAAGLVVTGSF